MIDKFLLIRAACSLLLGVLALPGAAFADEPYRVSGPFIHANLAIYLLYGKSTSGPIPLTLQEALASGAVRVEETGDVNQLTIENVGREPVFVQSGEIVKGGQQDRVFTSSLLLPAHSGSVSIAAFCVEHGRWSARVGERADGFASSEAALPSREAKLAMKAPHPEGTGAGDEADDTGTRQQMIWAEVADIQKRLSANLGVSVASPRSTSSLQLALENDKLETARQEYVAALQSSAEQADDVVGYAFAINGKLNSADLYPSNGLFRKLWPKLLAASATEAIGESEAEAGAPPPPDAVLAFLTAAETGTATETSVNDSSGLETRDSDAAVYVETRTPAAEVGGWIHRNYLAK